MKIFLLDYLHHLLISTTLWFLRSILPFIIYLWAVHISFSKKFWYQLNPFKLSLSQVFYVFNFIQLKIFLSRIIKSVIRKFPKILIIQLAYRKKNLRRLDFFFSLMSHFKTWNYKNSYSYKLFKFISRIYFSSPAFFLHY